MNKISWPFMLCHQRKIIIRTRCCKTYTTDIYRFCLSLSLSFPFSYCVYPTLHFCALCLFFCPFYITSCLCLPPPPTHPFIHASTHRSINPSTYSPTNASLTHPPTHPLTYPFIHLAIHPSSHPSIQPSIPYPAIQPSIHPFLHISLSSLSSSCLLLLVLFVSCISLECCFCFIFFIF